MKVYEKLDSISFLRKNYVFKFLFVAFVGIHIPLIGILFLVLYSKADFSTTHLLLFTLVMTLVATGITLILLKKLVKPITLSSNALSGYKLNRTISSLPIQFSDEAGLLLSNIQDSILKTEAFINEKKDLIYLLSHDLKNFAVNPKALAQLILEKNPSREIKEFAELICESSDEQYRYLENFIKMLKEQDELLKTNLEATTITLEKVTEAVEAEVANLLVEKNIKLVKEIQAISVKLKIEEMLLIRILVNLLNNAIKFSFSDSEIQLKIYLEKEKLYFEISDQGIGFESKDTEKMFSKFTKMSRLGTLKESSTGIGLYLCKQIIERNNGVLLASSAGKNKGAIFTVVFNTVY